MRKTPLLFSLLLFYSFTVLAQYELKDTLLASQLLEEADGLLDEGAYDAALEVNLKALEIYQSVLGNDHLTTADTYKEVGVCYGLKRVPDLAFQYFNQALEAHLKIDPKHYRISSDYNNLGVACRMKADYTKALAYYQQSLDIKLQHLGENHVKLIPLYENIGICYIEMYDWNKGLLFLNKALNLAKENYENGHRKIGNLYNNIGAAYSDIGNIENSIKYFNKSLEIRLKTLGENHPLVASCYLNIGLGFSKAGRFDKAIEFLKKANEINKKGIKLGVSYKIIGETYSEIKNFDLALSYYNKALLIFKEELGVLNSEVGMVLSNIGILYLEKGEYEKALNFYDEALLSFQFDIAKLNFEEIKDPNECLDVLILKGELLFLLYQETEDQQYLVDSEKHYAACMQFIDFIRLGYREDDSKTSLIERNFKLYEGALDVNYALWKIEQKDALLEKMHLITEQSKSLLLLEAAKKAKAERFANIPKEWQEKKQALKVDIGYYEKQLIDKETEGEINESERAKLNSNLFDLKESYLQLIKNIEEEYPDYYRLKYDLSSISVQTLQTEVLTEDQTLLSYFSGDRYLYVIIVTKDNIVVERVQQNILLNDWVKTFRQSITAYNPVKTQDSLVQNYVTLGYQLYQQLIKPFEHHLTSNVVIIPDGYLGYLPFDALLSDLPASIHNFRNHAYLNKKYAISYSYSASLLKEMQEKQNQAIKSLLAFAPSFEGSVRNKKYQLEPLKNNQSEVDLIINQFGGDAYKGEKAIRAEFIKNAAPYRMLHLAMHAKANDTNGELSYLAFTDTKDSMHQDFLSANELYGMKLNADMVVLSACETGIGELKRGEGIISLARAFSFAGAKSIITSLWSISDQKTADLMQLFYGNLVKGISKDEALQKAKIAFIEANRNATAHPFYWAGFIPIGNMEAISIQEQAHWYWMLIALFGILVGFYFYRKLRN